MRKSLVTMLFVCALAGTAAAQEVPRESSQPVRPPASGMRSQVTGARGKAPIIG